MPHAYACQLRWADMDQLGHVNNVSYVDYLQEARVDLLRAHAPVRAGRDQAGLVVVRNDISYLLPLVYRAEPVTVELWVSEIRASTFTVSYEILDVIDGARVVYARARTMLAYFDFDADRPRRLGAEERAVLRTLTDDREPERARASIPAVPPDRAITPFSLSVRWSDIDAYSHVNNVKYVEYFQEARLAYLLSLVRAEDGPWATWVLAQADLDYLRPVLYRAEDYQVRTVLERIGTKSIALLSELVDPTAAEGSEVLARCRVVLVTFDLEAQASVPMPEGQRRRLESVLVG